MTQTSETPAFLAAVVFDIAGEAPPKRVTAFPAEVEHSWLHFDRHNPDAHAWLRQRPGMSRIVFDNLIAPMTRPRFVIIADGVLLNLRGVNLNENADPEDMLSVRIWATKDDVISLQGGRLRSIEAILSTVEEGEGPSNPAALLVEIARGLTAKMGPTIESIDDRLDELEARVIAPDESVERVELTGVRQRAIGLRRYLAPQSSVVTALAEANVSWLTTAHRAELSEVAHTVTRLVEDLDAARARGGVIQDELANQLNETTNNRMYIITMIAAIFLPLTFLTGVLGMNVGGIPLATTSAGFWVVMAAMVVMGIVIGLIARRARWL